MLPGKRMEKNSAKPETPEFHWVFGFSGIIPYGHSCASLLISQGFGLKDVQEWLGHADITLTANTYAHLDSTRKQSIADALAGTFASAG